jgi:hypothetical protein
MRPSAIIIRRATDCGVKLTFTDVTGDGPAVLDLTGNSLYFTVKKRLIDLDADVVISRIVTSHSDPTNGITHVMPTHDDTDLTPRTYFYGFKLVDSSDHRIDSGSGSFNVSAVTRIGVA